MPSSRGICTRNARTTTVTIITVMEQSIRIKRARPTRTAVVVMAAMAAARTIHQAVISVVDRTRSDSPSTRAKRHVAMAKSAVLAVVKYFKMF